MDEEGCKRKRSEDLRKVGMHHIGVQCYPGTMGLGCYTECSVGSQRAWLLWEVLHPSLGTTTHIYFVMDKLY